MTRFSHYRPDDPIIVRLTLKGGLKDSTVEIDGHELRGVAAVSVEVNGWDVQPRVTITVVPTLVEVNGEAVFATEVRGMRLHGPPPRPDPNPEPSE